MRGIAQKSKEQPNPVVIRHRTLDDIPAISELMRRVYPPPRFGPEAIWGERNLLRHLAHCNRSAPLAWSAGFARTPCGGQEGRRGRAP